MSKGAKSKMNSKIYIKLGKLANFCKSQVPPIVMITIFFFYFTFFIVVNLLFYSSLISHHLSLRISFQNTLFITHTSRSLKNFMIILSKQLKEKVQSGLNFIFLYFYIQC
jgi:hypothetical protein